MLVSGVLSCTSLWFLREHLLDARDPLVSPSLGLLPGAAARGFYKGACGWNSSHCAHTGSIFPSLCGTWVKVLTRVTLLLHFLVGVGALVLQSPPSMLWGHLTQGLEVADRSQQVTHDGQEGGRRGDTIQMGCRLWDSRTRWELPSFVLVSNNKRERQTGKRVQKDTKTRSCALETLRLIFSSGWHFAL